MLREESFLQLIGEQIGQVISIDNSEAYRAKLFGPRIRLLVRDIRQLPQTVVIPRLDGAGTVEYKLEFSGLPKQCGRCRAHDHLVRNCPKKPPPAIKKEVHSNPRGGETRGESLNETEPEIIAWNKKDTCVDQTPGCPGSSEALPPSNQDSTPRTDKKDRELPGEEKNPEGEEQHQIPPAKEKPCNTPKADTENNVESPVDHETDTLQPDDINFPKLQSPATAQKGSPLPDSNIKTPDPQFVWKSLTPTSRTHRGESSKGKERIPESTPLTRQGYRSGRLAEDFWSAIGMPNTPSSNPKMLRVIPFLSKNRHTEQAEYLVDKRGQSFGAIAHVHIAELLAGIPWTQSRARTHVTNEVSQTLHKMLIFNNNLSNPFQQWSQGQWYAHWGQGADGEHICTLYVSIDTPEHKVKPRKGFALGWRREPVEISSLRASQTTEDIQIVDADLTSWQRMAGRLPNMKTVDHPPPESHNRFASLLEEEDSSG